MSNPTTKEEAAYQAIRSAIIDGELKPGQSVRSGIWQADLILAAPQLLTP